MQYSPVKRYNAIDTVTPARTARVGRMDPSEGVAIICSVTGCSTQEAQALFEHAAGDVTLAINDFFMAMNGEGDGAPAGNDDPIADEGSAASDGMASDIDDGFDGLPAASAPLPPPPPAAPPPKRAKVELRSAPIAPSASAALLKQLQTIFGLTSIPTDASNSFHRAVSDRISSWAHGEDRCLSYLASCYSRLPGVLGGGPDAYGPDRLSSPVPLEEACYPFAALLHHARVFLLSGEAHDDGLALFDEGGGSSSSELQRLMSTPSAAPFIHVVNASMNDAEQDQVYSPALEGMLKMLGSAAVDLDPAGGAGKTSKGMPWRDAIASARALLCLAGPPVGTLKPLPHGQAVRQVLSRRMADETALLRSGQWAGVKRLSPTSSQQPP